MSLFVINVFFNKMVEKIMKYDILQDVKNLS
jgi:hypothetical protein